MPDFEPLYTSDEMRAAESGHDTSELMERAGAGAAELALQIYAGAERWTVVCGGGSNGGDGRIVAQHLLEAGKEVHIVEAKSGETELGEPHVIVDALFGTGFSGEPRAEAAALIEEIWRTGAHVLSIDLPSGVDASTGEIAGAAIRADETVTFHGRKVGLVVAPGRFQAGNVHIVDIGLELGETAAGFATVELLRSVPRRSERDNKYTAGHVLVVGGSRGFTGAPSLSALAALRADAGYVTVAVPESTLPVFELRLLEAVKRPLPDEEGIVAEGGADIVLDLAAKASAVGLGPGLGRGSGPRELVRRLLARLLGKTSHDVAAHRLASVREAVERFGCVVVLKGPDTLIAAPDHDLVVSALGLPSLATAGTGDVLTGIVAAFLAKGVEPHLAAAAAVVAQQCASVEAPQRAGLVASDLIDALPRVLD